MALLPQGLARGLLARGGGAVRTVLSYCRRQSEPSRIHYCFLSTLPCDNERNRGVRQSVILKIGQRRMVFKCHQAEDCGL
jgi:hypothetical protein